MLKNALLSLVAVTLIVANVKAQESEADRGRLPDGRAYRTDQEGNQLVDYIAELELEKENLEGRIFNLQDKVREVQTSKAEAPSCPACEKAACPAVICPKIEPISCPAVSNTVVKCPTCDVQIAALNDLKEKFESVSSENSEIESEKNTLVEELGTCQTKSENFQTVAASLNESLSELRKALGDRDASLQMARAQISELREDRQRILATRAEIQASDYRNDQRASYGKTQRPSSLSSSALVSARAQMIARVKDLQTDVRSRDEQFLRIDQRGKSLQVKPAALKTRSGFELKSAEAAINNATTFKALAEISRELDALTRIVSDDIRLAGKLTKR